MGASFRVQIGVFAGAAGVSECETLGPKLATIKVFSAQCRFLSCSSDLLLLPENVVGFRLVRISSNMF